MKKILILFAIILVAGAGNVQAKDKSTQYWPVGDNILNFGEIDVATGKPAILKQTLPRSNSWPSVSYSTKEGIPCLIGHGDKLFYKYLKESAGELKSALFTTSDIYDNDPQGAALIPVPGETDKYYYFFIDNTHKLRQVLLAPEEAKKHGTVASVSDASECKAISVTETAAKDGYWLATYLRSEDVDSTTRLEVFKVTSSGISKITDASSVALRLKIGMFSNFKFNPDGKSLAMGGIVYDDEGVTTKKPGVALLSFDPVTGKIRSAEIITCSSDEIRGVGGCEFSSNGKYIYLGVVGKVFQVDLSSSPRQVKTMPLGVDESIGCMQLALDGKIYGTYAVDSSIVRLSNINNVAGAGDGAVVEIVKDFYTGSASPGLPVFIQSAFFDPGIYVEAVSGSMSVTATRSGASPVDEWGICWGKGSTPTTADNKKFFDVSSTRASFDLTDSFGDSAKIYVRCYAVESGVTVYGSSVAINRIMPIKAEIKSKTPAKTSISFDVEVTNPGSLTVAEVGVCLGTDADPDLTDTVAKKTGAATSATVKITGLTAGTSYNCRAFVKFADNTVKYGTNVSVKTLSNGGGGDKAITVLREDGTTPVSGAVISSVYYRKGGKPVSVTSDGSGQFTLPSIPKNIKNVKFVIFAANGLPKTFLADSIKNGEKIKLTDAVVSLNLDIRPDKGKFPSEVLVTAVYADGSKSPEAALAPGSDGFVKVPFGLKSADYSISIIADGFKPALITAAEMANPITLVTPTKFVSKLLAGDTPKSSESGEITFTITAADGSTVESADYAVNAYEIGTLKALGVSAKDSGKGFTVTCSNVGDTKVQNTGVLLTIKNSADKKVLVETWLSSKKLSSKVTKKVRKIEPVDVKAGGEIEAKDGSSSGMSNIRAVLPPGGIDTSGLNTSCGTDPTAFLEVNVYKLGETVAEDVLERSKGSFTSLAEVSLDIFDCSGPVNANSGVLKELLITIPYDSSKVSVEDIENEVYRIYHSPDLSDFESLENLILVPTEDIKLIDPVAGTITFKVSHLSVFGVGASSSLQGSSSSSGGGGCTIGNTSDSTLGLLLLASILVAVVRSRYKFSIKLK